MGMRLFCSCSKGFLIDIGGKVKISRRDKLHHLMHIDPNWREIQAETTYHRPKVSMGCQSHVIASCLQSSSQGDIRLYVTTRTNRNYGNMHLRFLPIRLPLIL